MKETPYQKAKALAITKAKQRRDAVLFDPPQWAWDCNGTRFIAIGIYPYNDSTYAVDLDGNDRLL